MRNGMAWLVCVLVFAVGGLATWSLTRGQSPADNSATPPRNRHGPAPLRRRAGAAGPRGAPAAPPATTPTCASRSNTAWTAAPNGCSA